jgi:hypothetical protein
LDKKIKTTATDSQDSTRIFNTSRSAVATDARKDINSQTGSFVVSVHVTNFVNRHKLEAKKGAVCQAIARICQRCAQRPNSAPAVHITCPFTFLIESSKVDSFRMIPTVVPAASRYQAMLLLDVTSSCVFECAAAFIRCGCFLAIVTQAPFRSTGIQAAHAAHITLPCVHFSVLYGYQRHRCSAFFRFSNPVNPVQFPAGCQGCQLAQGVL